MGEPAAPNDLIPWRPGQWASVVVGPLGGFGGEGKPESLGWILGFLPLAVFFSSSVFDCR